MMVPARVNRGPTVSLLFLLILGAISLPAAVASERVLLVKTASGSDAGRGFALDQRGHVVAQLSRSESTYRAMVGGKDIVLERLAFDVATGLTLLRAEPDGVQRLQAMPVAREPSVPNAGVSAYLASADGSRMARQPAGRVVRWADTPTGGRVIIHDLPPGAAAAGSPLLNECQQVVGVLFHVEATLAAAVPSSGDREKQGLALGIHDVQRAFVSHGVAPVAAAGTCSTADDRFRATEAELQEMRRLAEEAAAHRSVEQARLDQLKREQEQASQGERERVAKLLLQATGALKKANAMAEQAMARTSELEQQLERDRDLAKRERVDASAAARARESQVSDQLQSVQRRHTVLWGVISAAGAALLGLLLLLGWRQRLHRQISQERVAANAQALAASNALEARLVADEQRHAVPDVLFSGALSGGWKLALRVPGNALIAEGGVLVGRNPPPPGLVINHEEVSRRHFRLRWTGEAIEIEDVGSTNGTWLDGLELKGGDRIELADGARLELGELALSVALVRNA